MKSALMGTVIAALAMGFAGPTFGVPAVAQKLTVLTMSHTITASDYDVTTPERSNTHCLPGNSVNCSTTTSPATMRTRHVYRLIEVVTAKVDGKTTRYTLSRGIGWAWSDTEVAEKMQQLPDGNSYPAEIKGSHMLITRMLGEKRETIKYSIIDEDEALDAAKKPKL